MLVVSNRVLYRSRKRDRFANGGSSYTQNRFQVGVQTAHRRFVFCSALLLSYSRVNLPQWLDTNRNSWCLALAFKLARKTKTVRSRPPKATKFVSPERP